MGLLLLLFINLFIYLFIHLFIYFNTGVLAVPIVAAKTPILKQVATYHTSQDD